MTDVLTENAPQTNAPAKQDGPSLSDFVSRAANGQAADGRRDLVGITREELTELMAGMGESKFRVKQLWNWIYNRGVTDIEDMTNISKKLRDRLAQDFYVGRPVLTADQKSTDDTHKWLMKFHDGNEAETVYIPDRNEDRGAVCISSQVGCTLTCKFCHTGTQLLVRNLTPGEIVSQFMVARDSYGEWPTPANGIRRLSNIVMMGMGEPLFNYENVRDALRIAMDGEGISISRRRITLSTSGVVPEIVRCGEDLGVGLAISLHAPDDDLRNEIMPINKKYPLKELMDACRNYPGMSNARPITMEYVMLKGVNDKPEHARALAKLVKGVHCKFNLIPFNKWPGSDYECTPTNDIKKFAQILLDNGYEAPIRWPRGRDILAACGQLKSESQRQRKSRVGGNGDAGGCGKSDAGNEGIVAAQ
ncbi:MAG: 23S rRNA (adenine(2503)-C2)-methyltransferase [Thalassospira sp. Nap_22]|uniref:23S rRNA (adenine(2503)-C(2))-methyltransferase RlmN n=1 Tax=Thalassospira sp. A40-3 TaxID=2785908 RepID=UPI00079230C9|nr:23S rRNA (adenine(2503)-C(2))-methyltransferase RlmN [Thalassospira sp. A40-3]KXJ55070.1 MAG: 23S rRNA (adenine(2503)-C2)-methyltransferase [Thalassospira sp. Nap_22]QPO11804.1 23S rRNA (adenine(2503)-C(2))-methyltransferase RlmN [Thalassospira sp. A40-3]